MNEQESRPSSENGTCKGVTFAMTLAPGRVQGQRKRRLESSEGPSMKGLECRAKGLELSAIGNGEPLEDCEQGRDTVRFASQKLTWVNGLEKERPGGAANEEDPT